MNRKPLFLAVALTALLIIGGAFWLMQKRQMTTYKSPASIALSNCSNAFKGKYYIFRYPCEYAPQANLSDDRIVSFGSSDYLARIGKDGGSVTSPQGYIVTVSYVEIKPSVNEPNKTNQEQWKEWMERGIGSIGKSEFFGMTKDEAGKDIFKSVARGYGFMDEMKEKQVNVRIGLHNEDYTKSAEIEILTPEKNFDQNQAVLNDTVRTFSFN